MDGVLSRCVPPGVVRCPSGISSFLDASKNATQRQSGTGVAPSMCENRGRERDFVPAVFRSVTSGSAEGTQEVKSTGRSEPCNVLLLL